MVSGAAALAREQLEIFIGWQNSRPKETQKMSCRFLHCLPAIALLLTACAAAHDEKSTPPLRIDSGQPPHNRCDAKAAQFLVGQPFGAQTLAQALAAAGADTARVLRPGGVITLEGMMGRLNVTVDADNRVVRVHCG